MTKKNTFQLIKEFIYNFPEGEDFSRQELLAYIFGPETTFISGTIDNYRNQLTKCEYIVSIKRGIFRKVKEIPENMTSDSLYKEYKLIIKENNV